VVDFSLFCHFIIATFEQPLRLGSASSSPSEADIRNNGPIGDIDRKDQSTTKFDFTIE
jgi:hypothetical protein